MKRFYFLCLIICFSGKVLWAQDITTGLEAHYPFSTNALDASGNNYHGTVNGAVLVRDRFDQQNEAYLFDGENDNITIGENIDDFDDFTVSAWVYVEQFDVAGNNRFASIFLAPYVSIERATGKVATFVYGVNDQNNDSYYLSNATVDLDAWTFVAATYDAANDEYSIYVNDERVREFNKSGSPDINLIAIGGEPNTTRFFHGIIDDIRLYSRVLGQEDLDCLRNLDANGNCATASLFTAPTAPPLHVYPNPAQERVQVRLPQFRQSADLRVLRMDGSQVFQQSIEAQKELFLNTRHWSAGVYLLLLQHENTLHKAKLIVE